MIVIHNKIRKNKVINSLITNNNHFIHNKIKINHFIQTNQMINHNFLNSQNNRIIKKYKMKNKKNNHFIQIKLNQNNNQNNSNNQNNYQKATHNHSMHDKKNVSFQQWSHNN